MKMIIGRRRRNAVNPAKPVRKLALLVAALALPLLLAQPAKAFVYGYTVALDGPSEPTPSAGIGSGLVQYDDILHTLSLGVSFSGLTNLTAGGQPSSTTASHIHAATTLPFSGTAGVATTTPSFAGFPLGVTSGTFTNTLNLTLSNSWNVAFINANGASTAGAEAALFSAMQSGKVYWNIHSTAFGGGEIRGFLVAIPEPSAIALVGGAGAVFLAWHRNRRNR